MRGATVRILAFLSAVILLGVAALLSSGAPALSMSTPRAKIPPSPGPCEQPGAIAAIVDRPGLGRPTANNGSPCTVPRSHVVIEAGYRNQATVSSTGTSRLAVFPLALVRVGLGDRTELILQPPVQSLRAGANLGGPFIPAIGAQDIGFGFKRMFDDRPAFQDAVGLFYTAPTGTPKGSIGFSSGASTYTLSYTAAFPIGMNTAISITQNAIANAAPLDPSGAIHFFSYQPSVTFGYGFAPNFTALVSDQITTSNSGTGNRAFIAIQRVISPNVVLDAEYEVNALVSAPSVRSRAVGAGVAFEL